MARNDFLNGASFFIISKESNTWVSKFLPCPEHTVVRVLRRIGERIAWRHGKRDEGFGEACTATVYVWSVVNGLQTKIYRNLI